MTFATDQAPVLHTDLWTTRSRAGNVTTVRNAPAPQQLDTYPDTDTRCPFRGPGRSHAVIHDGEAIECPNDINPVLRAGDAKGLREAAWPATQITIRGVR